MYADFHDTAIATLDLDAIKAKLIHKESGEGWTRERADAVETEYRRFLYLMKKYPNEITAPLVDVDTFWHYHILDTMKYARDCDEVFGYFLHHFPYLGMRGEEDAQAQAAAGTRMKELYEQTFGVARYAAAGTQAAYCLVTAQSAYCIESTASAYCLVTAKSAYGVRSTESAYCLVTSEAAHRAKKQAGADSRVHARPVYSGQTAPA